MKRNIHVDAACARIISIRREQIVLLTRSLDRMKRIARLPFAEADDTKLAATLNALANALDLNSLTQMKTNEESDRDLEKKAREISAKSVKSAATRN